MKTKKGKASIDHGAPMIRKPRKTDVDKVQCTRSTTLAMQASPNWAAALDVQGAVKAWNKTADDIEANAQLIAAIKDQLKAAESKQPTLRRNWRASIAQVLSAVNVSCNGSVDMVKAWTLDVRAQAVIGAQPAPVDVIAATGKQLGEVVGSWPRGSARRGFVVQYATDTASPATYSAATPCTKTKYTVSGLPSASTVYLRVAAVDPTSKSGIGPWSAWAAGTAK